MRDLRGQVRRFARLFALTRPYRRQLVGAWIATGGYAASGALLAYSIKHIFDDVLIAQVRTVEVAVAILTLYAVKGLSSYFSTTLIASCGQQAVHDLRDRLYEHMLNQSFAFFKRRSTGSLMSHVTTDVERLQNGVAEVGGDVLKEGLSVLGLIIVLFVVDWRMACLALFGLPVAFYPLLWLGRRVRSSNDTSLRRWTDISEILQETIAGFRIVKAFSMEGFETERFQRASRRLLSVNLKITRQNAKLPPLMEALGGVAVVATLFYGSHQIRLGTLSTGDFVSFIGSLLLMYTPIKRLSRINATLQAALAASRRVFEILDTHQEVLGRAGAAPLEPGWREIAYRGVGFSYPDGGAEVLKNVDLTARAGEVVAIVGSSGAGKTTLVNLLPRFYDATHGAIEFDGVDIRDVTLESLRGQIGLVTQETVLFNTTVGANIAYGRDHIDRAGIEAAARAAFAHDFILDLPRRYDTVLGERAGRLSGGQRQRIAIARALFKNPPILILDEATSALDAESEQLVQAALANLMKGRTVFVIAHRLSTVRQAHRIVALEGGEVCEVGTHKELMGLGGVYHRLHQAQFVPAPTHERSVDAG
jgi:subfamily B ATP-binding cassette protein MsbA